MGERFDAISKALKALEIDYDTDRNDDWDMLIVHREGKMGNPYDIHFVIMHDSSDHEDREEVGVRVFQLLEDLTEVQCVKTLPVLNRFNMEIRFFRMTCDRRGRIGIAYDFATEGSTPEKCVRDVLLGISRLADKAYPALCEAIGCEG